MHRCISESLQVSPSRLFTPHLFRFERISYKINCMTKKSTKNSAKAEKKQQLIYERHREPKQINSSGTTSYY